MMPITDRGPTAARTLASPESLTEADAAARLGLKVATLPGVASPQQRPGIRAPWASLYATCRPISEEFLEANRHAPTSDSAGLPYHRPSVTGAGMSLWKRGKR